MTKKELFNLVAKSSDLSFKQTKTVLENFFKVLVDNVSNEEKISLTIGTFTAFKREARVGRNPQNGQEINIPSSTTLKFKASNAVKKQLTEKN